MESPRPSPSIRVVGRRPNGPTTRSYIEDEAIKSAKEVYLACLFLMIAVDERYRGITTALDDNYLLDKQDCPQDLLCM